MQLKLESDWRLILNLWVLLVADLFGELKARHPAAYAEDYY